jgi:chaperonin GroES
MSKINLKPLADRVVIEPMAAETKTASGIYIPDTAQEKPQRGKVIAVGTGTKDEEMKVKLEMLYYMGNMQEQKSTLVVINI